MARLSGTYRLAVKRLSGVEMDRRASNQHEINGVAALRDLLGGSRVSALQVRWHILRDSGEHLVEDHHMSWYDARERHEARTEWRLYYDGITAGETGDLITILQRAKDGALAVVIADAGSTWERQIQLLSGIADIPSGRMISLELSAVPDEVAEVASDLFDIVGWHEAPGHDVPAEFLAKGMAWFREGFPATEELSVFVRDEVAGDPSDPDGTLLGWWRSEHQLFIELEKRVLGDRLGETFDSVDDFLSYSLSVQNRRKSRAGRAFESHLRALFENHGLRFSSQSRTEGGRQPDFLFPGTEEYHDLRFPPDRLTMLGAKTTCKDRWRQVLTEAARIPRKHLCTLEPAISEAQLSEMADSRLTPVVPAPLLKTYRAPANLAPISLGDFIAMVHERQRRAGD